MFITYLTHKKPDEGIQNAVTVPSERSSERYHGIYIPCLSSVEVCPTCHHVCEGRIQDKSSHECKAVCVPPHESRK